MERREFIKKNTLAIGAGLLATHHLFSQKQQDRPNILWLVSEDNSASYIGCYGNKQATTPNIDNLAKEGIRYEKAFANAPVCAPMRNTLITGMFASTLGTHNMRSYYDIPKKFKFYPQYLREAGYYCTNNSKEDYNTSKPGKVWDESSNTAHYKNRQPGQPFFAIFNTNTSHEHKIHFNTKIPREELKHDPDKIELAPYHPDLPKIRHTYATYYDYVSRMDREIGNHLKELEERGLADDTIVFYYSDHGGVLPRSKRFLFESGTHIPLIVRFPKKYKHLASGNAGSTEDRLVSISDLPPSLLSLLNIDIPERYQGLAFLGKKTTKAPEYVHFFRNRMDEVYDMMRSVRDKKYRYIRNYYPHRKYGQHLWYLWRSEATRAWETAYKKGGCNDIQSRFWEYKASEELYDCEKDPHNIHNLAADPKYKKLLQRLRKENIRFVKETRDAGFIPEGMMVKMAEGTTIYEMKEDKNFPIEKIIETAEMATMKEESKLPELIKQLDSDIPAVRYWAATACAILPEKAKSAMPRLKELMQDEYGDVRVAACEALCKMGYKKPALLQLVKEFDSDYGVRLRAINTLDALEDDAKLVLKEIMSLVPWKKTDDDFHKKYADLIKKLKPGWGDYNIW